MPVSVQINQAVICVHAVASTAVIVQRLGRPAASGWEIDRTEMILCRQCDAVKCMRPEQGHINQVVGFGNTSGQIGGSCPRIERIGGVVACCDAPVAGKTGFYHEVYILEIGVGIASDLVVDRIADIS